MPPTEKLTTRVSTKGQVILPKAIRAGRHWEPGTRLIVEETAEGVLLRQAPHFTRTEPDKVFGSLRGASAPKSIVEMEASILAEAKRRHVRD